MNSHLRLVVRLTAFVAALGIYSSFGAVAQADGRACNPAGASEAKWIALTKGDSTCSSTTRRQQSWFLVQPGTCVTMFTHSAAGRQYWYYEQGANSGISFPGGSANAFREIFSAGFGTNPGTCFDTAQLSCTNPGVSCATVAHVFLGTINSTRLDINL